MRTQIATAVILACGAGSAGAADWNFDPKITLKAQSDDNNRLTSIPGEEISVAGGELDAQLLMRAETPRSSFRLAPRVRATLYPGDEDEETDGQFLHMDWEHRGERSVGALDLDYSHRTILGRYFPDSAVPDDGGLGEPGVGEGVGLTPDPTDEDRFEIVPSVAFELTERTALEFEAGYLDVAFDDRVVNDRVDFTDLRGSAELRFRTSQTATLGLIAGMSKFEPEGGLESDAHSLTAEWSNQVSDKSRVYVRGGANRVKMDDIADSDWETGFNGGAGVQWSFQVTQIFVELNHYIDPNSSGRIVERDQLRFELSRQTGPRSTLSFAARGIRDADTGDDSTFQTREYAAASIDWDWRFTRQFSLIAGYEYAWRELEDEPNSAESNRLYVGITYQPNRL